MTHYCDFVSEDILYLFNAHETKYQSYFFQGAFISGPNCRMWHEIWQSNQIRWVRFAWQVHQVSSNEVLPDPGEIMKE